MELVWVLGRQILIMFLFILAGIVLYRTGKLTAQGSKDLAAILLNLIIPCVIINSYMTEFTMERLIGLGMSFLLALLALLLSIVVSQLLFKKHPLENFGTSYSNAGYLGIPLVSATLGTEAVFYASAFVACLNVLQWTYGVYVVTGDRSKISVKKILTNSVLVSLLIGLVLFLLPFEVPELVTSAVSTLASMNAPVAMFIIGTYLAQVSLKELVTDRIAWLSTLVRLLLIPVLTIVLLTPFAHYETIRLAVLIEACAPVGANVAIVAQLYDRDASRAVKSVCLSTICSMVTMPLILMLAQLVW